MAFTVAEARRQGLRGRLRAALRPGPLAAFCRANRLFGSRGAYFDDPDGHNMEIITRPYARP